MAACTALLDMMCSWSQEKRSAYAPPEAEPVRYDGIYRVVRAYRKPGNQGKLVCRYLFIRCDNAPAPWSSEGKRLRFEGLLMSSAPAEREAAQADGWAQDLETTRVIACVRAEQGDGPWNGTLPSQAQAEVEQADEGEVYEMASMPWW